LGLYIVTSPLSNGNRCPAELSQHLHLGSKQLCHVIGRADDAAVGLAVGGLIGRAQLGEKTKVLAHQFDQGGLARREEVSCSLGLGRATVIWDIDALV
jgi:hypothetical protein